MNTTSLRLHTPQQTKQEISPSQALGFVSMVVLLFDVLLAFLALRAFSDSREFGLETEKSKSALYAVKSGRSLVGHSSTQVHPLTHSNVAKIHCTALSSVQYRTIVVKVWLVRQ